MFSNTIVPFRRSKSRKETFQQCEERGWRASERKVTEFLSLMEKKIYLGGLG
jgi:hypothetical protein